MYRLICAVEIPGVRRIVIFTRRIIYIIGLRVASTLQETGYYFVGIVTVDAIKDLPTKRSGTLAGSIC